MVWLRLKNVPREIGMVLQVRSTVSKDGSINVYRVRFTNLIPSFFTKLMSLESSLFRTLVKGPHKRFQGSLEHREGNLPPSSETSGLAGWRGFQDSHSLQ